MTTWLDYLALAAATARVVGAVAVDRARAEDHFWADRAFREDHTLVRGTKPYRPARRHIERRVTPQVYGYVHAPEPRIRVISPRGIRICKECNRMHRRAYTARNSHVEA